MKQPKMVIDLSKKSEKQIADFLQTMLAVKYTLYQNEKNLRLEVTKRVCSKQKLCIDNSK